MQFGNDHKLRALAVVPMLDSKAVAKLPPHLQEELYQQHSWAVKGVSALVNQNCDVPPGHMVFSAKKFDDLPIELIPLVKWKHVYLELENFPELETYVTERAMLDFGSLKPGETRYVNLGLEKLMQGVSKLLDKGAMITVDYGSTHYDKIDMAPGMRTYTAGLVDKDFAKALNVAQPYFEGTGLSNVTTDVNFSALAELGIKWHLVPVSYSFQKDLRYLMRMDENTGLADQAFHVKFDLDRKKNNDFKFLVQRTASTRSNFHIPARGEHLLRTELLNNEFDHVNHGERSRINDTAEAMANILVYLDGVQDKPSHEDVKKMFNFRGISGYSPDSTTTDAYSHLLMGLLRVKEDLKKNRRDLAHLFQTFTASAESDDAFQKGVLTVLEATLDHIIEISPLDEEKKKIYRNDFQERKKWSLEQLSIDASTSEKIATIIKVVDEYLQQMEGHVYQNFTLIKAENKTFRNRLLKKIATAYLAPKNKQVGVIA